MAQQKMQHNTPSLESAIEIGFLQPGLVQFYKTEGGFTGLRYGDAHHPRIILRRAMPMGLPMEYISVADPEQKEIGILRSIDALPREQQTVAIDELNRRYYCPEIYEIKSVKDKMGYVYMEMEIGANGQRHAKSCAVKDVNRNIRMIDDERLLIFDVDGNRYIVSKLSALDKKSLKRLEPYMF